MRLLSKCTVHVICHLILKEDLHNLMSLGKYRSDTPLRTHLHGHTSTEKPPQQIPSQSWSLFHLLDKLQMMNRDQVCPKVSPMLLSMPLILHFGKNFWWLKSPRRTSKHKVCDSGYSYGIILEGIMELLL